MTALPADAVAHLLVQLGVVLLVALVAGGAARWLGQPAAVGQVVGGVLIGPGTLGAVAPGWDRAWLPTGSAGGLLVVAALGAVTLLALAGAGGAAAGAHIRRWPAAAVVLARAIDRVTTIRRRATAIPRVTAAWR